MTTKEKLAVPLDFMPSIVALNNGERMSRKEAKAKGYKIYGEPEEVAPDAAITAKSAAHASWRGAVLLLPEARDREAAATEIVNTHTEHTMTVANARAFLRGLPTETTEETTTMTTDTNANPERAARLAEIQSGMAAFNKGRGYKSAPNVALRPVQERTDIEPVKLQRLTEIRLKGLCQNGRDNSEEAKILRNALDTHHRVGTPLNRALAQHGFDAATLLPKI